MAEKIAFDPAIHLIPEEERKPSARRLSGKRVNGKSRENRRNLQQESDQSVTYYEQTFPQNQAQPNEDDDAALALKIQEELLLADRQAEEKDMALARQIQHLEEETSAYRSGAVSGTTGGGGGAGTGNEGRVRRRSSTGSGIFNDNSNININIDVRDRAVHNDEALARQLQQDSLLLAQTLGPTNNLARSSNPNLDNDLEIARRMQNYEQLGRLNITPFADSLMDTSDSTTDVAGGPDATNRGRNQINGYHGAGNGTNRGSRRPSRTSESNMELMLKMQQEQDDEIFARTLISSQHATGESQDHGPAPRAPNSAPQSLPTVLPPPQQLLTPLSGTGTGSVSGGSPIAAQSSSTPLPEPFPRPRTVDRLASPSSSGNNFPGLSPDHRAPRSIDSIGMDPLGMDSYGMDLPFQLPSDKKRLHGDKKHMKENRRSSWRPQSNPLPVSQPGRRSSDDMFMGSNTLRPGRDSTVRIPRNQTNTTSDSSVKSNQTMPLGTVKKKKGGLFGFVRRKSLSKDDSDDFYPSSITDPVPPPPPNRRPGPLPNSVSVNKQVPISPQPQQIGGKQGRKKTLGRNKPSQHIVPICDACGKPALSYLSTLQKKYHPECFKCIGCHLIIDPSEPFAFSISETGEKCPLHRHCYAELFGIKCVVCKESIPTGPDGKVSYVKHPFFENEHMCPRHASNPGRRCTGCHRFEPIGNGFADLGDANRCVCLSCCRSVIVDSDDAKPLWDKVVRFMEHGLGLPIWKDMRNVPVLVVGYDALNEQMQNTPHAGSSQIMTRGLCLSEHQSGKRIALHRMKFDRTNQSFIPRGAENKGYTYIQVPEASKINPDSSVTAILCLSGLPSDLTASVLAHEATHAWFKIHPNFDISKPIPPQVEEGCCQLMAMLFLNDGLDPASSETSDGDEGPSDEKLRQYFKFSIETDESEIYGTGYRSAAKAFANIGIEALLSHVLLYGEFPKV